MGYDQYGQRSRVTLGNGTETRYQRDPLMQRLQQVNTNGPGATPLQRLRYAYNAAGNITERNQKLSGLMGGGFGGDVLQTFDYDEIGQLTSATGFYQESGTHERRYTLAMQYDTIGNITNKTQNDVRSLIGGGSPTTLAGTSHTLSYTYLGGGSIRPHAATKVGNRTFTFDPNGNQLGWSDSGTGSTRSMAWDEDDRLESVTTDGSTVNFLYDGAGERTHKYSSAGVSVYANAYWSVRNGVQTTKHIFASGQRIASIVNDPATGTQEHWFHTDHLGSTQFVTDGAGAVREHHESFPFGEPWIEESSASDTTPFRFTGKELDPETGLQYFGARYYDPRQGQWASVDPILRDAMVDGRIMEPRRVNLFSYSWNSPVELRDPDGRDVNDRVQGTWSLRWNYGVAPRNPLYAAETDLNGAVRLNFPWNAPGRRTIRMSADIVIQGPVEINIRESLEVRATTGIDAFDNSGLNRPLTQHEYGHYMVAQRVYSPTILNEIADMTGLPWNQRVLAPQNNTAIQAQATQMANSFLSYFQKVEEFVDFYVLHRENYARQLGLPTSQQAYRAPAVPVHTASDGSQRSMTVDQLRGLINRVGSGVPGFVPLDQGWMPFPASPTVSPQSSSGRSQPQP
ncbi:MAG: RHS repeat-associated core domain-containing protein [Myxococcales bacterium]|nr:RHS repeat-associated core domain-containing protein [Myxococcales bacterium]